MAVRALLNKIRRAFLSGTLIRHYFLNKTFRVNVSLLLSLVPNVVYLIFNFVSGIRYGSLAFLGVSLYYALHIYVRYIILNFPEGEDRERELAACRKGGFFLLIADVLITPMLIFGVLTAESDSYSVPVLIFLAFYALFGLISASVGAFKSRRDNIPIHRAAYSVRLASGALSLFNLVSAVTESYAYNERASEAVCVLLGAAVSLLVLYLSFSMIFSAVKTERRI